MFNPSSVHQKCVHHTRKIHFIGRRIVFQILHLPNDDKLTTMYVRILVGDSLSIKGSSFVASTRATLKNTQTQRPKTPMQTPSNISKCFIHLS